MVHGEVMELIDDPARTGLLVRVAYEDNTEAFIPAAEGMYIGQRIEEGAGAKPQIGNIMQLKDIPESFPIFNLETRAGDGGSLIRSSGSVGFVISKLGDQVIVKLPSRKIKYFDENCRATIGCCAGGGRLEKPLLRAGNAHYKHRARNRWWPRIRGVHMNACDHPYGGKQHHGNTTPKGRGGSPGQHVGSFGSRRTGRRKR